MTPTSSSGSGGGSLGGFGDSSSELPAEGDALGHGVGEGSESEDAEAKEVNLGLADMSRPPSHVSTSLGSLGLDFCRVKVFNGAVQQHAPVSDTLPDGVAAQLRRRR